MCGSFRVCAYRPEPVDGDACDAYQLSVLCAQCDKCYWIQETAKYNHLIWVSYLFVDDMP